MDCSAKMAALVLCTTVLLVIVTGVSSQLCAQDDPCDPSVPCQLGTRLPNPPSCFEYQECVAPYTWAVVEPCSSPQTFDHTVCICMLGGQCYGQESCPPLPTEVPTKGNVSAPCFYSPDHTVPCTENGVSIPDKSYCTRYHRCYQGTWNEMVCPKDTPYFDLAKAFIGHPMPCDENPSVCREIPFDECTDPVTLPTTTAGTMTTISVTMTTGTPVIDPCAPDVPCTPGERISFPENCTLYQVCAGPHQWVVSGDNCGGEFGPFSNITGTCNVTNKCHEWNCTGEYPTQAPPIDPGPCLNNDTECVNGRTVPDSHYCSLYYRCVNNEWNRMVCPLQTPYYSVEMEMIGFVIPCTSDVTACELIDYNDCDHFANWTTPSPPEMTDPCAPTVPCTPGERISFPENCTLYQVCAGPHQWVVSGDNCGGPFNNITGTCNVTNECHEWNCTGEYPTQSPPIDPEPCYANDSQCITDVTVPDRYYCSIYYKCVNGEWGRLVCPELTPYYSVYLASLGTRIPCTSDVTHCEMIIFDDCTYPANSTLNMTGISGPCLADSDRQCTEGHSVPDRLDCTQYFTCHEAAWTGKQCPSSAPYFDMHLAPDPTSLPCSPAVAKCDLIPFHICN